MLMLAISAVSAQDNSTPQSAPETQTGAQQPIPAYGQENAPTPITENPPLSGMDLPSLEPHSAPLSYLQPGATFSESASSNLGNTPGGSQFGSISRGLANLALKRLWSHYDLALDYVGGVAYYSKGIGFKQLQDMGLEQKILWKRGQLSLRDSFSYLPEGNFGGAYGSLGSSAIATMGHSPFGSFWSGSGLGALGLTPRVLNVSLGELSENLTPKSALTAAGGYAFTHFYGNNFNGSSFIGSSQVSGQVGYNRILTSHTQMALVYGYQGFDFSVLGTAFHSHIVQGMYGHRISGRMDLLVGAGPQITMIGQACTALDVLLGNPHCSLDPNGLPIGSIPSTKIGVAGQARLRYKFTRTAMDLRFERFETSGDGLFAGAQTNIVRLSAERPLSRVWGASVDLGYAHNSRLQPLTPQQQTTCGTGSQSSQNACPAADARTYVYGFAGLAIHRHFGREFHGFLSYQDNELWFDHSYCALPASGSVPPLPCNRIANRQVVTFGLDWTPRPIRID